MEKASKETSLIVSLGSRHVGKSLISNAISEILSIKKIRYACIDGLAKNLSTLINRSLPKQSWDLLVDREQEDLAEIFYREYSLISKILARDPRDVVIWNRLPLDTFFFTLLSNWKSSGDLSHIGLDESKFLSLTREILKSDSKLNPLILFCLHPHTGPGTDLACLYESYMKSHLELLQREFNLDIREIPWKESPGEKVRVCLEIASTRLEL